nr:ribonuclease H-like domain-containing protein [Tanacetum cinerariifolium]
MPPDLVFNNAPHDVETDHPTFTVKLSHTKPNQDLSLTNRPSAPIIEDWVSDTEDESEIKTPQNVPSFVQSTEVAERKNRTLIEAARTMLADSKLPTTFWAEAVNNACYVQNRVLVVMSYNKTSYELFYGRTPTLSFMRPFGFPDTILNTLNHKFDGKADEGTQSNDYAGTKASDNASQARKETEPVKDYILLPLWAADLAFSQNLKSSHDDGSKPSSDNEKKVDEDPRKENECNDQEKENNVNNTNNVNTMFVNLQLLDQEDDLYEFL